MTTAQLSVTFFLQMALIIATCRLVGALAHRYLGQPQVVGEMIASQSGLGQAILLAARAFRANELFAGIVLLGLIGFLSNALLALAERRLLKWQAP